MNINTLTFGTFVKKSEEEIRKEILTNIIKMLCHRKWLNEKKWTISKIQSFIAQKNDDDLYIIKVDFDINNFVKNRNSILNESEKIENEIHIKLLTEQKISSISNTPIVTNFINKNPQIYKILVVKNISDKIEKTLTGKLDTKNKIITGLGKLEIFEESFLLIDLTSINGSPSYDILTKDEKKKVMDTYSVNKHQLPKILLTDPIVKYLNLVKEDVIRIYRKSQVSGISIGYRIVY